MDEQIRIITQWLGTGSINIFGRPFSGKDTQGKVLAQLFDGILIGGGDILRSHHDPAKIKQIMASGGIIPSDFYEALVIPYLSKAEFAKKPLILSAVGRSHGEEPVILRATETSNHPTKAVIALTISDEKVWKRFEAAKADHDRGDRSDDQRGALTTRLQEFHDRTLAVIEFYRNKNLLLEVSATTAREEVTQAILDELANKAIADS